VAVEPLNRGVGDSYVNECADRYQIPAITTRLQSHSHPLASSNPHRALQNRDKLIFGRSLNVRGNETIYTDARAKTMLPESSIVS